ncbi:hypothetical protein Bbelb_346960 [Branchiostoma belcheri]|nr:hypothetical protein Bbelb_346960 [Branchiostoma belcheri]
MTRERTCLFPMETLVPHTREVTAHTREVKFMHPPVVQGQEKNAATTNVLDICITDKTLNLAVDFMGYGWEEGKNGTEISHFRNGRKKKGKKQQEGIERNEKTEKELRGKTHGGDMWPVSGADHLSARRT